jgi:hypothetical protein
LALRLALDWRPHHPAGQLYVNLRRFDATAPLTGPLDALRDMLQALGVPAETPPRLPKRAVGPATQRVLGAAGWLVNHVVSNAGSLRARTSTARRDGRVSPDGTLLVLALLPAPVAIILLPAQAMLLIYAAWMFPMAELALMLTGLMFFRHRFRENAEGFTELIIQVTSGLRAAARRGGHRPDPQLPPGHAALDLGGHRASRRSRLLSRPRPPGPGGVSVQCEGQGSCLEYSRQVRHALDLARPDVKIIFNDTTM